MAMLIDLLKNLATKMGPSMPDGYMEKPPSILEGEGVAAGKTMTPDAMQVQQLPKDPSIVYNDAGDIVGWNKPGGELWKSPDAKDLPGSNPFADAITKSRANNNTGPGVLRQLLSSILGGGIVPNTGTVGGGGPPDHVPGTRQDAVLNPTPLKSQRQSNLVPTIGKDQIRYGDSYGPNQSEFGGNRPEVVNPGYDTGQRYTVQPKDYSMPRALDPQSLEELRTSLLTQAGQLDAGNPNGLAGRMSDPNAAVDQRNQMGEAQRQHDSLRGFDGSRAQKIKDANGGR